PVADAGLNATITIGASVTFDGSDSTDNVGVSHYSWVFVYNGSTVELYGENPTFTFWTEGIYDVTLVVTDGSGNSDSDAVTVAVMDGAIPEFGYVVASVAAILAMFVFARFYLGRGRRPEPG
ncbi:MAG TPA: PKD domain-containing protein, partial [Thermoplasmata archaeon]|nr:PKD domain-containing protein [Thermoplasmata archaeon]